MLLWHKSESVPLALSRVRCRPAPLLKGQRPSESETRGGPRENSPKYVSTTLTIRVCRFRCINEVLLSYTQAGKIDYKSSECKVLQIEMFKHDFLKLCIHISDSDQTPQAPSFTSIYTGK